MYLYGASGHGKVLAEIAEENNIEIEAFIDGDINKKTIFNYPVLHNLPLQQIEIVLSLGNNLIRKKVAYNISNVKYLILIHPKSIISKRASIDIGSVVMAGSTINSDVKIGKHCIINTNASIDHDCVIGDFVHISPNAALAGNVKVGEGTHIGIGTSVIQGIEIGKWCTIGAGSVIINNIPDGVTVVGNPGKIIKIKDIDNL